MKELAALMLALALFGGSHAVIAQSATANGQVIKVDQSAKKITIKHGPMPMLDMNEGMTMVYAAPDPSMFLAVKPGDKVKFDAGRVNGQLTLTKIEKAK